MSDLTPQQLLRRAEHNVMIAQRDLNYYRGLIALHQRDAAIIDPDALPDVVSLQHRLQHSTRVLELAISYRNYLKRVVTSHPTGVARD